MRVKLQQLLLLGLSAAALTQVPAATQPDERFGPLKYADLTPAQKDAVEGYEATLRTAMGGEGPYDLEAQAMIRGHASSLYVAVRSPELSELMLKTSATLQHGVVTRKLNELAVMMTARYWTTQYVWWAHHKLATQFGLSEDIVQAIALGKRPRALQPDERAVYDYVTELRKNRQVSDPVFEAAKQALGGERGVVELMGIMSNYELICQLLTVDRFPLPPGAQPELKPL